MQRNRFVLRWGILLLVGIILVLLLSAFTGTHPVDAPPRPTLTPTAIATAAATLMPSPTATASPVPDPDSSAFVPATIVLHEVGGDKAVGRYWTVVQWQDAGGTWHDVTGWQAPFNEFGQVCWAVAATDYGSGPFRWVVYKQAASQEMITISDAFNLPKSDGAVMHLVVSLP